MEKALPNFVGENHKDLIGKILFESKKEFPNLDFGVVLSCNLQSTDGPYLIEPGYSIRKKGFLKSDNFLFGARNILKLKEGTKHIINLPFGGAGILRYTPEELSRYEIINENLISEVVKKLLKEYEWFKGEFHQETKPFFHILSDYD